MTIRRGAGKLTASIAASDYRITRKALPQGVRLVCTVTDPDGEPLQGAAVTFTLSIPGIATITSDGKTNGNGRVAFKTTIPRRARHRPGHATVPGHDRRLRLDAGLHGHHDHEVARRTLVRERADRPRQRLDSQLPSAHADVAMPPLRDTAGRDGPLLGLPAIQHRLSDLPALPSLGRGQARLLRARSRRRPLIGDEIRPCWEAGPLADAPAITAAAAPDPTAPDRPSSRLAFVEVGATGHGAAERPASGRRRGPNRRRRMPRPWPSTVPSRAGASGRTRPRPGLAPVSAMSTERRRYGAGVGSGVGSGVGPGSAPGSARASARASAPGSAGCRRRGGRRRRRRRGRRLGALRDDVVDRCVAHDDLPRRRRLRDDRARGDDRIEPLRPDADGQAGIDDGLERLRLGQGPDVRARRPCQARSRP